MLSFVDFSNAIDTVSKDLLTEGMINKHSTHIEEMIFTQRKQGLDHAIQGLQYIVSTIGTGRPVSTKIDGCVDENTIVVTSKGGKRIADLTNQDFIKCVDLKNNCNVTYCANTNPRITGKTKNWVTLFLSNGGTITCTEDHQILNDKKRYLRADQFEGQKVYSLNAGRRCVAVKHTERLADKRNQWDLTTPTHNFVIDVNGNEIVIHNSPAVFLINGEKGFAVASKSIFNKNAKINYSEQDIDANHSGGLAQTLKYALKYFKDIMPNKRNVVYQGDILFTKPELQQINYNDKTLLGFRPNTILYTVEANSDVGKQVASSDIGIAMHTEYSWDGKDPTTLQVQKFGIDGDIFNKSNHVFLIDTVNNINKVPVSFTTAETTTINNNLSQAEQIGQTIDWNILNDNNVPLILTFINSYIRSDKPMPPADQRAEQFVQSIEQKIEQEQAIRKTSRGKQQVAAKYQPIADIDVEQLAKLFQVFDKLTVVKNMIIGKLNNLSIYHNFVVKTNGDMEATGEEGFVVSAGPAKGVKLVDRYTFSRNNFSKEIIHGFENRK